MPLVDVYATKPYGYGGQDLEAGEIFRTKGLRNDQMLFRHGFMVECETKKADRSKCDGCGKEFVTETFLRRHQAEVRHDRDTVYAGDQPQIKGGSRPASTLIVEDKDDREAKADMESPVNATDIPRHIKIIRESEGGGIELS